MEKSRFADASFKVCNEITDETTSLYEALADMEVEEARIIIASIELKLNSVKLKLDEI